MSKTRFHRRLAMLTRIINSLLGLYFITLFILIPIAFIWSSKITEFIQNDDVRIFVGVALVVLMPIIHYLFFFYVVGKFLGFIWDKTQEKVYKYEKLNELWPGEFENRFKNERTTLFGSYPPDWKRRTKFVKERENYICQQCGLDLRHDQIFLDVHHTYSIADQKHNVDSLVLLCCWCHSLQEGRGHWKLRKSSRVEIFKKKYAGHVSDYN